MKTKTLDFDHMQKLKRSLLVDEILLKGDVELAKDVMFWFGQDTPRWIRMIVNGNLEFMEDLVIVATLEYFQEYKERIAQYGSSTGS